MNRAKYKMFCRNENVCTSTCYLCVCYPWDRKIYEIIRSKRGIIEFKVFSQRSTWSELPEKLGRWPPASHFRNKTFMLDQMTYSEWLKKLPYFRNTKTSIVFFCFSFHARYFIFSPNECPGLCRHRGKNTVARNEKRKKLLGFSYS